MAIFTETPYEHLIELLPDGADIMDVATLKSLSKQHVFSKGAQDALNELYRDAFMTSFLSHYMFEEIGFETWARFQFALQDKCINYTEYITSIYEQKAKQLFTHVHHRTGNVTTKSDNQSTTDSTGSATTTGETLATGEGSAEISNKVTQSSTHAQNDSRNGSSTNGNTSSSQQMYSDTPQNGLTDVLNGTYLSSAQVNSSTDSGTSSTNDSGEMSSNDSGTTISDGSNTSTTSQATESTTKSGTQASSATTSTDNTVQDSSDEDYDLDYETLMKSIPLPEKLWMYFDDLFMTIIE